MNEAEWLECTYAPDLLDCLRGANGRRLRLFACACCRAQPVWRLLQRKQSRHLVEVSERFADDSASVEELLRATDAAPKGSLIKGTYTSTRRPNHLPIASQAERAVIGAACTDPWEAAWQTARMAENLLGEGGRVALIRDIFNNPFRSVVIGPTWRSSAVKELGRVIYDERAFGRMPDLADALQSAGCSNTAVLNHCRGPGPHAQGCWVVNLVLAKV